MSRFDADTALEPAGTDGRWRARVHEHWLVGRGPNGGFIAALAARAAEALDGERPLRSLTVHYLEGPAPGPVDVRAAVERSGTPPQAGAGDGRSGGWLRTAEPRALDAVALVAYADAWVPAAFSRLGAFVAAPTLDLTIHVRAPLPPPGMDPQSHVLGVFSTRWAAGGLWEEDGELWSPDGLLLAHSRQLALVRT